MKRVHGFLMRVLDKDTLEPKALHRWNRHIFYCPDDLEDGRSAFLYYVNDDFNIGTTLTSTVVALEEDVNNLTITTRNSIYYIKKFNPPKACKPCQHDWEDTGYVGVGNDNKWFKCRKCGQAKVEQEAIHNQLNPKL